MRDWFRRVGRALLLALVVWVVALTATLDLVWSAVTGKDTRL